METTTLKNGKEISIFNDRYVWLLLIISLSVRIYLSFLTYVIKNDSVDFMQTAAYFSKGDYLRGLEHNYHPLYSFMIAIVYKVVPNMELSGTIVSVIFGTSTVIVFYLIGKNVFDQKVSFVSAIILAFHPYAVRLSADIISESTYFFFFISSLGLGFFAITNRRYLLFALSGICSALAYLARPEGIGVMIIVAFCCALKDCTKIKILWKEKLVSILILIVAFLVFSMPYLVYIKKETGDWHLTKKKYLSRMAGIEAVFRGQNSDRFEAVDSEKRGNSSIKVIKQTDARKPDFQKHINSILHIAKKYINTFHPFLFIFLIIGVINWTRISKERHFGFYIITVIVFYLFILYRLRITTLVGEHDTFLYPSRRHLMPLVIPAIFCAGIGVYTTGTWMHKKFQGSSLIVGFKELLKSTWIVQLIVLMIVVSVLLPKTLKPQRFDKHGIKEVGKWVKEHSYKPFPSILSTYARNAYYADGEHVQMKNVNQALTVVQTEADYMLITYREYRVIEKELQLLVKNKKIALAYKYPENDSINKRSVLLYKILY